MPPSTGPQISLHVPTEEQQSFQPAGRGPEAGHRKTADLGPTFGGQGEGVVVCPPIREGYTNRVQATTFGARCPIPHLHSEASRLDKKKVFSKIDLLQAYHQIPIREEDTEKTAISTPFGLFEYLYMPFGLRNAGATFQRYMDHLFRDISYEFVCMDDLLIYSETEE